MKHHNSRHLFTSPMLSGMVRSIFLDLVGVADHRRDQHVLQDRNDHEKTNGVPEWNLLVHVRQEVEVRRSQAVPDEVEWNG